MWLANLIFTALSSYSCFTSLPSSAYLNQTVSASATATSDPYWEQGEFLGVDDVSSNEYLHKRQNFLTYYFSNLTEHFPENKHGSCGYVACAMYLTYLDTFWDDNIVEEDYEDYTVSDFDYGHSETPYLPYDTTSPGCYNESELGAGNSVKDYYDNIVIPNKDKSLQFLLISEYILGNLGGSLNIGFGVFDTSLYEILQGYLVNYRGYDITSFDFFTNSEDHEDIDDYLSYNDFIKKYIDLGIPVLCTVKNSDGKHVVIAYDYDETSGEIYYHFGYHKDGSYHRPLVVDNDVSYDEITSVFIVRPKYACQNPKNYYARNSKGNIVNVGWESLALSSGITKVVGDNVYPAAFISEKWFFADPVMSNDYVGGIVFFDYMMGYSRSFRMDTDVLILTQAEWEEILKLPGDYFYASVYIDKINSPIISYGLPIKFYDPKPYEDSLHFDAVDFGFTGEYCKTEMTSSYLLQDYLQVNVSRLRTGYIENSFINLSPRREGYGESYLELVWDKPIYGILIGLAKWNDEFYINENTECYIEVLDDEGVWQKEIDLVDDVTLPIKRHGFLRLNITNDEGCWGIRIVNNSEATGSRNLNRLSIDQIVLSENLPGDFPYVNY